MRLARIPSVVAVVSIFVVAGCGGVSGEPRRDGESAVGGSADDPVRSAFLKRTAYDTCGKVTLGQSQGLATDSPEYACLTGALDDRTPRELVIAQPTTEGDMVVTYVRVNEDGSIETFTDPTADRFAGSHPRWEHQRFPAGTRWSAVGIPITESTRTADRT